MTGDAGHRARRDAALVFLETQVSLVVEPLAAFADAKLASGRSYWLLPLGRNHCHGSDLHAEVQLVGINADVPSEMAVVGGADQAGHRGYLSQRLEQLRIARPNRADSMWGNDKTRIIAPAGAESTCQRSPCSVLVGTLSGWEVAHRCRRPYA